MLKATPGERLGCPWPAHKGARSHQYPALDRLTHARDRARLLKPLLLAPLPKLGLLHLVIRFVLRTKHIAPAGAQNHALERLTHARDRARLLKPLLLAKLPGLGRLDLGIGLVLCTKHLAPASAQN